MSGIKQLLPVLLPRRCVLCGGVVPRDLELCAACGRELHVQKGRLFRTAGGTEILAPFVYTGRIRDAMYRFKNNRDLAAGRFFARAMAALYRERFPAGGWELAAFVPSSAAQEARRGYNPARLLAELFAGETGVPVCGGLLNQESRFIHHQLGARMRRLNARTGMTAAEGAALSGERVILIDDVCTTGSTLESCRRVLLEIGASEVLLLTAAAQPREEG